MLRLVALLALFASCAVAQDNHYWTLPIGSRTALRGGIGIGGVDDTSSVFYNPGRLGYVRNDQIRVSGNLYQMDILSLERGAGRDQDLTSQRIRVAPLGSSGVYLFDGADGHALGYTLFARSLWNASASARREDVVNIIDDARSPGAEDFVGQASFDTDLQEYWAGIGYSWQFHPNLSFGMTNFGVLRFQTLDLEIKTRAVGSNNEGHGSNNSVGIDFWHVRILSKIGFAADFGDWKFGATVTTPSLSVLGRATVRRISSIEDLDLAGNGTGISGEGNDRQESIPTNYRSGWAFGTGAEWHVGGSGAVLSMDAEWFLPIGRYKVINPSSKDFYLGTLVGNSKDILAVYDGKRGAFNIGIGVETHFAGNWTGVWGTRIDRAADYLHGGADGLTLGLSSWDLYHLTTGVLYRQFSDEGILKYDVAVGFQFTIGAGEEDALVNLKEGTEASFLLGATGTTDISFFSIGVMVSYTYYF